MKEIRLLGPAPVDKDDNSELLAGYKTGNITERLAHFFWLLGEKVANLCIAIFSRDTATQAKRAWFAAKSVAAARLSRAHVVYDELGRDPHVRSRSFCVSHEDLISEGPGLSRAIFGFLNGRFNRSPGNRPRTRPPATTTHPQLPNISAVAHFPALPRPGQAQIPETKTL